MKKRTACIFLAVFFTVVLFVGCDTTDNPPASNKDAYVLLIDSPGIDVEKNLYQVERGGDFSFNFKLEEGFIFQSIDYNGEYTVTKNENVYVVNLFDVKYDSRVTVSTNRVSGKIFYYLNGGQFVDENKNGEVFTQDAITEHHLRPNTDIGKDIYREGYTQLGWNTEPDGSGQHIGLGSRVTVNEGESVVLYAEWIQWSPSEWFTYVTNHETRETGDITLIEYNGAAEVDTLVIPAEIDGKKVSYIADEFSSELKIGTLVLPNTMHTVKIGAFRQSAVKEIYFFDNLMYISNGSFDSMIPTVHINAVQAPRYLGESDNSHFADDMDRLILNADKKKMVFFAGCSMSYGLNSKTVEEAFNGEYTICNMGVIGGTNALFQFECIAPYMKEGDIFIHAPEEMSSYQLLHKLRAEQRMFVCTENNYDLLGNIDLSQCGAFFDCFTQYNAIRSTMPASSYDAFNKNYNEYGDIVMERPNSPDDADYELETLFDMRFVSEEAFANLNEYYGRMEDQGAEVYFSFAPLNINALSEEDNATKVWVSFEERVREGLDPRFQVISTVTDYLMPGKYFYDSDYHLSNEGAAVRTEMLIRDIKSVINQN